MKRKRRTLTITFDPLQDLGFENLHKAVGSRPGFAAQILLLYGLEHADEAWRRFIERGSENTRRRRANEAREEGRAFIEALEKEIKG